MRQGVYATRIAVQWAGTDATRRHVLRVLAVLATVGHHAVASHHSAALLHRLDLLNPPPEGSVTLTCPPGKPWNRARPASVVFHTADLPTGHLTRLYSLPVTTAARTVIDLARTLPFADAVVAADSALHKEKATKPELGKILDACARWPGVRQARQVVEFADERAESPLESVARVIFDQSGLDSPELQATVFTPSDAFRVDFLWRAHKVIAEVDGLGKYNDRSDAIRQLERDRRLRDAGFRVVHFTWKELFGTPELVLRRIREAIAAITPY
jgi:very-short-patch-repair endonuclease